MFVRPSKIPSLFGGGARSKGGVGKGGGGSSASSSSSVVLSEQITVMLRIKPVESKTAVAGSSAVSGKQVKHNNSVFVEIVHLFLVFFVVVPANCIMLTHKAKSTCYGRRFTA